MNKAFEKILERLKEKLKKSEERYHRYLDDSNLSCMFDKSDIEETRVDTIKEMLEIVQEVTEEYNNGWIPCSDRLPEEHKLYDITFKNDAGIHSDSAIYNPYLKRWLWNADETELVENEVLAWAEKREPYQSKGE